jgi:hypothetical protein
MKKFLWLMFIALTVLLMLAACNGRQASVQSEADSREPQQTQPGDQSTGRISIYPAPVSYIGDSKWGYIDTSGKFVLKPDYSSTERFQPNGLAVAGKEGKVGLIKYTGKFVVEPVYQSIGDFSDGLAIAQDENGFSVIDAKGNIISGMYPFIGDYKEGRAVYYVELQGGNIRYGYLGENGQTAIAPVYEYAFDFNGGLATAKLPNDGYVIIDKSGNKLKTLNYNYVTNISDGMIPFSPYQDGKFGYLNSKGDVAIEPMFLTAEGFRDGTAVVNAAADFTVNKYGLIDKKGKYLIKPQYNEILQLGEGMVALGLAIDPKNTFAGSKYALATSEGTVLTDFIFYGLEQFNNGAASVYDNTSTFFIDKQGKRVESLPSADGIGKLELLDSLVYADIDKRPYYMNRRGEIVYRPSSAITLKSGVNVSEEKFRPNRNYLVYYPVLGNLKDLKVQDSINTKLRDMWIDKKIIPTDNLDYSYEGDFKIGFNRKNLLELQKSAYDYPFGAAHGMPTMDYVHIDTRTGAFYQLEDLFKDGSDYVKVLSDILKKQIAEHGEEMGVWPDSYKGIKPDQPFFLSSEALMLYFEPYEIAPYAAGFPTFTVPFAEISDIIDKNGSFWLSFN